MGAPAHDRKVQAFTVGLGASPLRTRGCVRVTGPHRSCQHLAAPLPPGGTRSPSDTLVCACVCFVREASVVPWSPSPRAGVSCCSGSCASSVPVSALPSRAPVLAPFLVCREVLFVWDPRLTGSGGGVDFGASRVAVPAALRPPFLTEPVPPLFTRPPRPYRYVFGQLHIRVAHISDCY